MQSKDELLHHEVYQQTVESDTAPERVEKVFQCRHCLTVYDPIYGDELADIPSGTAFDSVDSSYECSTCSAPKMDFVEVEKRSLIVQ